MRNPEEQPSALILDFGCRLNQAEGASLASELLAAGFRLLSSAKNARPDLVIVNSCAVTAPASAKSFAAIRKLRREHPDAFMILTGCAASVKASPPPEGLPFDLLIPNESKASAAEIAIARFGLQRSDAASFRSFGDAKTRVQLKIQDGCDKFCAFCIVPFARGRERSVDPKTLLDDAKRLLDAGYKEIVLTGVNISNYRSGNVGLPELLEQFLSLPGDFRLRLGSAEPDEILPRVVDLMASDSRLCRFLHMPLQHGSERMLKAMGRKCPAHRYAELVAYAREKAPNAHIGADVIAGLPGETEEIFEESRAFIESLSLSNMHVFSYSAREGTRAASMPGQVSAELIKAHHGILTGLASAKAREYALSQRGLTLRVLTERGRRAGWANGWTDNYMKVVFPLSKPSRNEFCEVMIESVEADVLQGRAIPRS